MIAVSFHIKHVVTISIHNICIYINIYMSVLYLNNKRIRFLTQRSLCLRAVCRPDAWTWQQLAARNIQQALALIDSWCILCFFVCVWVAFFFNVEKHLAQPITSIPRHTSKSKGEHVRVCRICINRAAAHGHIMFFSNGWS